MKNCMTFFLYGLLSLFVPFVANAGLVTGQNARVKFEEYKHSHLDMFVDFEQISPGPYSKLPGLQLNLFTTLFRWPRPIQAAPANAPVILLPYDYVTSNPSNNRLMGAVSSARGYIPDGQSRFEIVFPTCLDRVGLHRMWNTYSTTAFYQKDRLLAEHRNQSNEEFVGYIVDLASIGDDCVTRVVFDGDAQQEQLGDDLIDIYQVGSVDDLYYSTSALQFRILLDTELGSSLVRPGRKVFLKAIIKNLASYSIENILVSVRGEYVGIDGGFGPENYDYFIGEIPGGEERSGVWDVLTDKNAQDGFYKITFRFYRDVFGTIYEKTLWYQVQAEGKRTLPTQSLFQLLLKRD